MNSFELLIMMSAELEHEWEYPVSMREPVLV
jgi:hypothetical protein